MGRPRLHSTCTADGCGHPHVARGLCGTHYQRWRAANPGAAVRVKSRKDVTAAEMLDTHTRRDDGHLVWTQGTYRNHPRVAASHHPTCNYRVWLWEELHGTPVGTSTVWARPDCPPMCVHPDHLVVASRQAKSVQLIENTDRSLRNFETLSALSHAAGNRSAAARSMGISRTALLSRLSRMRDAS